MLVVIDLQKGFLSPRSHSKTPARLRRLKKHVVQQIAFAKKQRRPIVLVEYKAEGDTVPWVKKAIGKYTRVYQASKGTDNAYRSLRSCFKANNLDPKKLTVCGVNTHYCVGTTLQSLVKNGYDVTVPWGAVECCESREEQWAFLNFECGPIRIV